MLRRLLVWLALLIVIWLTLAGADVAAWVIAVPSVAAATATALAVGSGVTGRLRVVPALAFVPFFIFHSLRGGWDVARRALQPALPIDPERITYRCALPAGPARALFVNLVSLLPGTMFLGDHDGLIQVHVVDRSLPVAHELANLETRVEALFAPPAEPVR